MAYSWVLALVLIAGTVSANPLSERIVGGNITSIDKYPSIVQLDFNFFGWGQSCAAIIIRGNIILSAAHCSSGWTYSGPQSRRIRVGTSFLNTGGILHYFDWITNHPSYGTNGYDADIMVGRLLTVIDYNPNVQPATIISQGAVLPDNSPVVHAGWGTTSSGGFSSYELRDVTIYTVNNELCRQRYASAPNPATVTENMICAGILDVGGKDACQGDSGGPLYYQNILVGVVSWGFGCGDSHFPGVSTSVSSFTEWIVNTAT